MAFGVGQAEEHDFDVFRSGRSGVDIGGTVPGFAVAGAIWYYAKQSKKFTGPRFGALKEIIRTLNKDIPADRPVKITMPGPMTISDTTANEHYDDPAKLGADLADALNYEVLALAQAGCKHIQIDEPVFARKVPEALDYGLENLERAFHGCPEDVVRTMHMCCGYPDSLDSPDYPKAPKESYGDLADAVDRSSVMAVSLEDTHRRNDLALLERFASTTVILGVVAIAKSHVESVDGVRTHLADALEHIDAGRLIAAPDCGLGLLGRERTLEKLRNLCEAAHSL